MYLVALLCPPLAVLLCGKPFQALVALCLWPLLIVPGVIYAWLVVAEYKADRRTDKLVRAVHASGRTRRESAVPAAHEGDNPFAF